MFLFNFLEYMLHHLNIEESEVPKMCLDLYREYGTTMAGLKVKKKDLSFFSFVKKTKYFYI